ncbi:MAG: hypothetical protein AAF623_13435 [Planctomycetota bacterium]
MQESEESKKSDSEPNSQVSPLAVELQEAFRELESKFEHRFAQIQNDYRKRDWVLIVVAFLSFVSILIAWAAIISA